MGGGGGKERKVKKKSMREEDLYGSLGWTAGYSFFLFSSLLFCFIVVGGGGLGRGREGSFRKYITGSCYSSKSFTEEFCCFGNPFRLRLIEASQ